MAATAEERIPALNSSEDIFSLAVPFAACSENRIGENAPEGQKSHQGIFSKNRTIAVGATRAKWSGTHQDSGRWWPKTVLEIAIDANGNTLSDPSGKSYSWDFENRLTQAVVSGTGTVTFKYDPFGRRIQKSGPLGTTNFLYDGRNSLEELDASGNVLARYNQGPSIDEPISELRGSTTSFYQMDFLGSITSLSNSAGALANTYTYDSFGKLNASTGTLTNPFQFTGREFDPETGVYNYRMRYYDQNTGRFLSEDPIRWAGGTDFYHYADGNPVSEVDPMGLDTKVCTYPSDVQPWGHIGFGLPGLGEQGTSGFYPSGNPIDSPGQILPDTKHKPDSCKIIHATPDQDQCMLRCRLKRTNNPGKYKGLTRQCTQFVRECVLECHEGNDLSPSPRPWDLYHDLFGY